MELQSNEDFTIRPSDYQHLTYIDAEGNEKPYPYMNHFTTVVDDDSIEKRRDNIGFTNPNLHRRVDPQDPEVADNPLNQEIEPRTYNLQIQGVHSYRTTELHVHDENSIDSEIP